jgi:outer membrane lipoprotein SlyB
MSRSARVDRFRVDALLDAFVGFFDRAKAIGPCRLVLYGLLCALAACASAPPGADVVGRGTVNGIAEIREASAGGGLAGSIGGAVVGAMIGSLFGGGTGQTIATGVGSVVGSTVGGQAGAQAGAVTAWDVSVRFEDGIDRVIRVYQTPTFRPGQEVDVARGVISAR